MIEYRTCIIKDGMSDREIFQTIYASNAYYVLDARTAPDRPLDVIYNEQRNRKVFISDPEVVSTGRRKPEPIKF